MEPESSGIEIVEPSKYNREIQLLPGSEERKLKLVSSLNELKAQMERDNKLANDKARRVNRVIIISSIIALGLMLFPGAKNSKSKDSEDHFNFIKFIRKIGLFLSIASFIKGYNGLSNSRKMTIIEPKSSETSYSEDDVYSELDLSKENDKLRELVVRSVIDTILTLDIMSEQVLRARLVSLKYKRTSETNKKLINAMIEYGARKRR